MTVAEVVDRARVAGLRITDYDGEVVHGEEGKRRAMLELVPYTEWHRPPFSELAGAKMILNPSGALGHDIPMPVVSAKRNYWRFEVDDGEIVVFWYVPVVEEVGDEAGS